MPGRDVVVVGASAGGFQAVERLLAALPRDFPAAILVVIHTHPDAPGIVPAILQRKSALPVREAVDGGRLEPGTVIVAPPDHHLGVDDHRARVWHGPKENRHRPAIDVAMRTVATAHGNRSIGVILTGLLDDGTAGLAEIHRAGGATIVQDPRDAEHAQMPQSAIRNVPVDFVLPLARIPETLVDLVHGTAPPAAPPDPDEEAAIAVSQMDSGEMENENREGSPSVYTCPDCSGTLWEVRDGTIRRFRCRVGHAYSGESLAEAQTDAVETALWVALRTLVEKHSLAERLADEARRRGLHAIARVHEQKAREVAAHEEVLRDLLRDTKPATLPVH